MKTTDFSEYISKFFSSYLVNERGASKNTISSYRDTLVQLIKYMERVHNINVNKLQIKHLTAERIKEFLFWLEREKQVSTATRNARLTALHSFLKYVRYDNIDCLHEIQKIMAIKAKKTLTVTVKYLTTEGIRMLLAQPDTSTTKGSTKEIEDQCVNSHKQMLKEVVDPLKPTSKFRQFWSGVLQSIVGAFIFALILAAIGFITFFKTNDINISFTSNENSKSIEKIVSQDSVNTNAQQMLDRNIAIQ